MDNAPAHATHRGLVGDGGLHESRDTRKVEGVVAGEFHNVTLRLTGVADGALFKEIAHHRVWAFVMEHRHGLFAETLFCYFGQTHLLLEILTFDHFLPLWKRTLSRSSLFRRILSDHSLGDLCRTFS